MTLRELAERAKAHNDLGDERTLSVKPEAILSLLDERDALVKERDKFKRWYELKAANAERWQPCPGHRGKIDTTKDGCPWCQLETATAVLERAKEAK